MDLKTTGLGMTTLIALIIAGAIAVSTPSVYYCAPRDLAFQCDRLSSTGKTCYIGSTYKVCTVPWEKLDLSRYEVKETIGSNNNTLVVDGRDWACTGNADTDLCYFGARNPTVRGELVK